MSKIYGCTLPISLHCFHSKFHLNYPFLISFFSVPAGLFRNCQHFLTAEYPTIYSIAVFHYCFNGLFQQNNDTNIMHDQQM